MFSSAAQLGGRLDLEPAEVFLQVGLGRQVDLFDNVEVHELDLRHAHRGQLQGDLPADGADTDDRRMATGKSVRRDDIPLTQVTVLNGHEHSPCVWG